MELPILYEDAEIVVIDKPSGVRTHPDSHGEGETVSDWFAARYPEAKEVGEPLLLPDGTFIPKPGIVHRLDRDTSGVLVLVKTLEAHAFLKDAFVNRDVHKAYVAFVYGTFKGEKEGKITYSIGRSRKDFRLRSAQPKAKGRMREAITHWKVLGETATHSMLQVMPATGRTHQIRVHLKAIHHPIVCDSLYAPKGPCDLGLSRVGLHAQRIDISRPDGTRLTVESPLPPEFERASKAFLR